MLLKILDRLIPPVLLAATLALTGCLALEADTALAPGTYSASSGDWSYSVTFGTSEFDWQAWRGDSLMVRQWGNWHYDEYSTATGAGYLWLENVQEEPYAGVNRAVSIGSETINVTAADGQSFVAAAGGFGNAQSLQGRGAFNQNYSRF